VKKIQRSFVTEYKSGRRKTDPQSNSIWGNIDLKSVARDVHDEAMPFLTVGEQDGAIASGASSPEVKRTEPLLTPSIWHLTTVTAKQETVLADEKDTTPDTDAPVSVVAAIDTSKKLREPRTKNATPEAGSAEVAADQVVGERGKQTRGPKPKSKEVANSAKSVPVKRAPKTMQAKAAPPPAAIDEMADLLQLEVENQRLRKLLAEKLRAENADLRKRLNVA
jgi:hypothetical protein